MSQLAQKLYHKRRLLARCAIGLLSDPFFPPAQGYQWRFQTMLVWRALNQPQLNFICMMRGPTCASLPCAAVIQERIQEKMRLAAAVLCCCVVLLCAVQQCSSVQCSSAAVVCSAVGRRHLFFFSFFLSFFFFYIFYILKINY